MGSRMDGWMCVCVCVCVCARARACVRAYVCMYVCMYACMYVCTYACGGKFSGAGVAAKELDKFLGVILCFSEIDTTAMVFFLAF